MPSLIFKPGNDIFESDMLTPTNFVRQNNILFILGAIYITAHQISLFLRHLGRHLDFLKTLNDDRLSSSRIFNGNV